MILISEHSKSVAEQAKAIYQDRLREQLESTHADQYVAIEPESGECFVAESYAQAVTAARQSHPERISFVIRIGHQAAIHLGGVST